MPCNFPLPKSSQVLLQQAPAQLETLSLSPFCPKLSQLHQKLQPYEIRTHSRPASQQILKSVICLTEDCIIRFALLVLLPLLGSSVISQSSFIIETQIYRRRNCEETLIVPIPYKRDVSKL